MELQDIIKVVTSDEPMTVAELQLAAAALGAPAGSPDLPTRVARVRVAFRLEKLGA
ncbi:hypothetical protein [Geodermatophilus sp. CPCC 206100]|uniref:hypothetical protein n=1 Tax=Geodermatophilus sp. CPCC 206100 TaxID=3020054 RepID=UPI003B008872